MSVNNSISARTQRLNKLILSSAVESSSGSQSESILNRETLLDAFDVLYNQCNKDALKKSDRNILDFSKKFQSTMNQTKKLRVNINDFNIKDLIGKGYFGEVYLAVEHVTHDVYAIKKMPKTSFAQSKEERNILANNKTEWLPSLYYAFQDETYLYLVMEYMPGGDLFSLMSRNNTFTEDVIQFYLAEITLALNALHSLGFVHRDIKPENILIDRLGHLKLVDFGSAVAIEKDGHVNSFSLVGTPDYIAPELLQPIHAKRPMKSTYTETCDFWSMGIIAYEMLTGTTPFHSQNVNDTYSQILSYVDCEQKDKLYYPSDVELSDHLRDLIDGLVSELNHRFSYKKIVTHRFFQNIDWMNVRQQVPPIIPTLKSDDDTSNFEEDIKKSKRANTFEVSPTSPSVKNTDFSGFNLPFVGYGYVHNDILNDVMHLNISSNTEVSRLSKQVKSLQKLIDTQLLDISSLQQNLSEHQKKSIQVASVEKILAVTKEEMLALKEKLKEKTVEIAHCRTQVKTLKNSLKIEEEQRAKNDANIADVLNSTYQKWERAKKVSEQSYEKQISEKKSEVLAIQEKLTLCEKELESKSAECLHLQKTVDNFKDRLKSSKNQIDTEINAFARKHRDSNAYFEGHLRELRTKLQSQIDAKHTADDEIQSLNAIIEENNQKLKLISDQREKLDQAYSNMTKQLNKEISENQKLHDENQRLTQKVTELQNKLENVAVETQKMHRASGTRDSIEGTASVYCSLESINSEVENQLKKDLLLAKECENEQRLRANSLEETVKRLEAAIERLSEQGISGVEVMLERKNEKLEQKLTTVQEQATVERQASRTAHLQLWKLEKELETVKNNNKSLEQTIKNIRNEKEDLLRKVKDSKITAQHREERITELQSDLTTLKTEMQTERNRWSTIEIERNKERAQIINQNTRIHKLENDLDECKSKMCLFEQQKNALHVENKQLTQNLRNERDRIQDILEQLSECQQNYDSLIKNHDLLKNVCSLLDTQLKELEEMYNAQVEQNESKSASIDKLWEDIRERDAKLSKIQQEFRDERVQKINTTQKASEMTSELTILTENLEKCQQKILDIQYNLTEKTELLMKAEELVEVQKGEIHSLYCINQSLNREIVIVKEENSKLLTELYMSKESYQKLNFEHTSLHDNFNDLKKEVEQLNGTMIELKNYHTQREIKFEATQKQYKKLIDYLQKRVDELSQKKKKTLAEVLFGTNNSNNSSKKENIPPIPGQVQKDQRSYKANASQTVSNAKKTEEKIKRAGKETFKTPTKNLKQKTDQVKEATIHGLDSDTHQFERSSYTNGPDIQEQCIVCKKRFVDDTVYKCKKCDVCVHQYCRGSNIKCTVDTNVHNTGENDETSSLEMFPKQAYNGDVVLREIDSTPQLKVLCMYEIEKDVLLLGCASGLKSFNVNTKSLIHIANIGYVINMAIVPIFPKSLLISENGEQLLQCDLRHLQTRAKAAVCLNTGLDYIELDLPFMQENKGKDLWRFVNIFDNNDRKQESDAEVVAIAATHTKIIILRYDIEDNHFKAIRSMDTANPIHSVYFTPFTAIVSSDKYFEIDLSSLISEEFLDLSDESLLCTTASRPMNMFSINSQEYLMCFEDFGIFVNEFGCRTRSQDIKWLQKSPTAFAYRSPILYIFSQDGIEMMLIRKSHIDDHNAPDNQEKSHKMLSIENTRFGTYYDRYGVYTLSANKSHSNSSQVIRIDSRKIFNIDEFDFDLDSLQLENVGEHGFD